MPARGTVRDDRPPAVEGGAMPTYIMLTTLTPEGAQTVHSSPDRLSAVNEEVEGFGCTVVAQYAVLGAYDFVTIVEAPDNETIAHLSVDLGSRGTDRFQTLPAIPVESLVAKLKGPEQLGRGSRA
jgi:uncharacterized protein with GYD domain